MSLTRRQRRSRADYLTQAALGAGALLFVVGVLIASITRAPAQPPQTLLEQDGYSIDASGLIEQWGRVTLIGGGGSTMITLPIPFPNQCLNPQATPITAPNTFIAYTVQIESCDTTTILISGNVLDATNGITSAALPFTVSWRALGW